MPDTEASFAELRDRCDRTIAFIESVDAARKAGSIVPPGIEDLNGRPSADGHVSEPPISVR